MSTIIKKNFELVSDLMQVQTKSLEFVDPNLKNPAHASHAVDGEWMSLSGKKMARAADVSSAGNAAAAISWPLWAERGRTDVQAIGKASLIYLGQWEADTRIFLVTTMAVGRRVAVASIDLNGKIVAGLVDNGTIASPGSGITVGVVTRMPVDNGGKLRIRGGIFF